MVPHLFRNLFQIMCHLNTNFVGYKMLKKVAVLLDVKWDDKLLVN